MERVKELVLSGIREVNEKWELKQSTAENDGELFIDCVKELVTCRAYLHKHTENNLEIWLKIMNNMLLTLLPHT